MLSFTTLLLLVQNNKCAHTYVFKFSGNHAESFQNLRRRTHHWNDSFSKRCIRDVDLCTTLQFTQNTHTYTHRQTIVQAGRRLVRSL